MHEQAPTGIPIARLAKPERRALVRILLPPLTIALAVVTAATLLLTAAAITPPSTSADPLPPSAAAGADTPLLDVDAGVVALDRIVRAVLPPTPAVVDLARLIYAPGTGGTSHALTGPLLLVVESGSLTVDLDGAAHLLHSDREMPVAVGEFTVRVGDGLLLPRTIRAAFQNGGAAPVVVLAAGIFPAAAGQSGQGRIGMARWADTWSPGAIVQPLAGGWLVDPPPGPATLELRRVSLSPNGRTPLTAPGAVVLAVEAGALRMVVDQGLIWRQPPDGRDAWIAPTSDVTLLPGDAALLQEAASATLRNAGSGPLLILVLTIIPTAERDPSAPNLVIRNRPGSRASAPLSN